MDNSLNMEKGERVNITKDNPELTKVVVGCGWMPSAAVGEKFDLDASIILLQEDKNVYKGNDGIIFFNNKEGFGVKHSGDNLTGEGDGDDEQLTVDLAVIPAEVHRIVVIVNIFKAEERRQHFGRVREAYVRVFNPANDAELAKFDLSEDYSGKTGMIMGQLYRHNGEWKFEALGTGANGSIAQIVDIVKTAV